MADEEGHLVESAGETQLLSAEYKDGQLQIVEVTPFDRSDQGAESHILPDLEADGGQSRYVQVINPDKTVMQLDLLNMTLLRCEDGSGSYKLVASAETTSDIPADSTVTCVLQGSDTEDPDNQDTYVMVNDDKGPLVFLQSSLPQTNRNMIQNTPIERQEKKPLTPTEILEKAKRLQKAKALLTRSCPSPSRMRGRKRKSDLPPPHELLNSPNFKLFLYSCKMCTFKCNAIKEMTAHKVCTAKTHAGLQCARCPYKGSSHSQLMRHVQEKHLIQTSADSTKDVDTMQVLVCGACGFESSSRIIFKKHLEDKHGAIAR
ncbi:uncharacterized protein LOC131852254 [Achroia grisella]|uniref:uncharacterized protein LOC131852254 n=1 Tax=Achroia grisella TaxID=688607 RepID=UPI0027D2B001|nr:uncharacterized protein LOC131852254 [Achroia grisella]